MTDSAPVLPEEEETLFPVDAALLLGLFVLFCGVYNLIFSLASYPVFRGEEWLRFFLLMEVPLILPVGIGATFLLRTRWREGRSFVRKGWDFLAFFVLPTLALGVWLLAGVFFVNGGLDSTREAKTVETPVVRIMVEQAGGDEGCSFSVEIPAEMPRSPFLSREGAPETFPLFCRSISYLREGDTALFRVYPGLWGLPWIERYEVTMAVGATIGPAAPYWPFWLKRLGLSWVKG